MSVLRTVFPEEHLQPQHMWAMRQVWLPERLPLNNEQLSAAGCKIPKPKGELSRLKRGGYSLKGTLGWDNEFYQAVQVSIHNYFSYYHLRKLLLDIHIL